MLLAVVAPACSSQDSSSSASTTTAAATGSTTSGPPTTGAPSTGQTDPVEAEELPFVGLDEPVELLDGVSVVAVAVDAVQVEALGPGDTSGPGFAVTLRFTNASAAPFDLSGLAVNATTGADKVPALPSDAAPAEAPSGELAPGDERSATFVFRSDAPQDETVELSVATDAGPRVARITW